MHYYAMYPRLFYDVELTMLDVWDNRQLGALRAAAIELRAKRDELAVDCRYVDLLDEIARVSSFGELYDLLGMTYVVDERGLADQFPDGAFDFIYSFHVLEHVPAEGTPALARSIHDALKPGGFTIHQIGIDDHLTHYDKRESTKNYLRYSNRTWKLFFENRVQYQNRLQVYDWLDVFEREGFSLAAISQQSTNIDSLRMAPKYQGHSKEDLGCTSLTIVHQKPADQM